MSAGGGAGAYLSTSFAGIHDLVVDWRLWIGSWAIHGVGAKWTAAGVYGWVKRGGVRQPAPGEGVGVGVLVGVGGGGGGAVEWAVGRSVAAPPRALSGWSWAASQNAQRRRRQRQGHRHRQGEWVWAASERPLCATRVFDDSCTSVPSGVLCVWRKALGHGAEPMSGTSLDRRCALTWAGSRRERYAAESMPAVPQCPAARYALHMSCTSALGSPHHLVQTWQRTAGG